MLKYFWIVVTITIILETVFASVIISPHVSSFLSLEEHTKMVNSLSEIIKGKNSGDKIVLRRSVSQSHCPRPQNYKSGSLAIDISRLNKVICIEKINLNLVHHDLRKFCGHEIVEVVDVQACMNFEDLALAILPLGLIPAVVPEFKGITIGGSLQGLAAESTSFKFGFVHDCIVGFEALLADGSIRWCSPDSNSDLFYGIPGSFGSLAICTRIKMLCLKATQHVLVDCESYNSHHECFSRIIFMQDSHKFPVVDSKVHFIEGISFSGNKSVVISGKFVSDEEFNILRNADVKLHRCNGWGNDWFFNQVNKLTSRSTRQNLLIPTIDYLFRHDQGSFWMASYRIPQLIGKIMGKLLDSSSMFALANLLPFAFPKKSIVLQDFMIPRDTVAQFFLDSQRILDIYPIWLLPMRNLQPRKIIFGGPSTESDFCNVGLYGIPRNKYDFIPSNKVLEALMFRCRGRKVYYSHAFHSRDFFYNTLYNGKKYFDLRTTYVPDGSFPEIFDKVITKNNLL